MRDIFHMLCDSSKKKLFKSIRDETKFTYKNIYFGLTKQQNALKNDEK